MMQAIDKAKLSQLFAEEKAGVLIGYLQASLPLGTAPGFIRSADALDKVTLGSFLSVNLVQYLLAKLADKPAIMVKSCDIPSVIGLIQEGKLTREQVVLVGVVCPGSLAVEKITALTGWSVDAIELESIKNNQVTFNSKGDTQSFPLAGCLMDKCLSCQQPVPDEAAVDLLIGDPEQAKQIAVQENPVQKRIAALAALPWEERWEFWRKELQKCIRCYACKNSCPVCYCTRCTVESNNPRWISPANEFPDNTVYQLMRLNHVAGRCTNCGECSRACPVDIPLHLLTGDLFNKIVSHFDYVPGKDPDKKPPLVCFAMDDKEKFIK